MSFPLRHRLIDPMGPTRRHKTISTHSAYMPCLAIAGPCFSRRRLVPRFHHRSLVACRSLRPRRAQPLHISSSFVACAGLRRRATGSALSMLPISGLTVGIPTKPDACTDLKPDSVPRRSRTPFRHEAGHFQRRPCGSWSMISEPGFGVQGVRCKSDQRGRRTPGVDEWSYSAGTWVEVGARRSKPRTSAPSTAP